MIPMSTERLVSIIVSLGLEVWALIYFSDELDSTSTGAKWGFIVLITVVTCVVATGITELNYWISSRIKIKGHPEYEIIAISDRARAVGVGENFSGVVSVEFLNVRTGKTKVLELYLNVIKRIKIGDRVVLVMERRDSMSDIDLYLPFKVSDFNLEEVRRAYRREELVGLWRATYIG